MNPRRVVFSSVAIFSLLLIAPVAHGQGRGGRGSFSGFRSGSSFRASRGGELGRHGSGRFDSGYGFPFAPYFYGDDYLYAGSDVDYSEAAPDTQYVRARVTQPPAPPVPPPPPGNTLILENRDGQWVRIPTGGEMVNASSSIEADTATAPTAHAMKAEAATSEMPGPALPPAVLVFRDGHSEEVQKYVIQGANLYATAAYSTTGSWTKKIPLSDLDIPSCLKINKDRGTKFNLPSGPNEVVLHF